VKTKQQFLVDLAERVFFTFAEVFLATLLVGDALDLNVDTLEKAGLAGVAAGLAVLKGALAGVVGQKGTAAMLPEPDKAAPVNQ
jgi:succinate-acetate transporter protein